MDDHARKRVIQSSADWTDDEKKTGRCERCSATLIPRPIEFNAALADALMTLYRVSGARHRFYVHPGRLHDIDLLTKEQWTTYTRMQWWGLIEPRLRDDGSVVEGQWRLSAKGLLFVENKNMKIRQTVWVWREETDHYSGPMIAFIDKWKEEVRAYE